MTGNGCSYCEFTNDNCSECNYGFYPFVKNNKILCDKCPKRCSGCDDSSICTEWNNGYFENKGECFKCSENCINCNSTHCIFCESGYYPNKDKCNKCSNGCQTCENSSYCKECHSGYYSKMNECYSNSPSESIIDIVVNLLLILKY